MPSLLYWPLKVILGVIRKGSISRQARFLTVCPLFNLSHISSIPRSDVVVFHAGTKREADKVVTSGGRVIAVSAHAPTLREALDTVYAGVDQVHFEGKVFRRDIAHRYDIFVYWDIVATNRLNNRALRDESASTSGLTYAQAGVSVDAGNSLVEAIKPFVRATRRAGADAEIGGFGGAFDLKATGYKDPILVSGTDGVGTKLRVAADVGIHDTIGKRPLHNSVVLAIQQLSSRHRSSRNVRQ